MNKVNEKLLSEANIGIVGHVAHGKTILTKALTGKLTLQHSEELKRGITIKLGYADATIYQCKNCQKYFTNKDFCPYCFSKDVEIKRTVSFLDAPGHEILMATVLTASALFDGAILVIAANEKCPQPQTKEHLKILEISNISNLVIAQNKIDLVTKEQAIKNYNEILEFIKNTKFSNAPIIPISAQFNANIHYLIEAIENYIPTPKRESKKPLMYVVRSFDINKPGTKINELKGAVLGGSIVSGKFKENDEIEIKPGLIFESKYKRLVAKIISIKKSNYNVSEAGAGGLVGLMTSLDPSLAQNDFLAGRIVGLVNELENEVNKIEIEYNLFEKVIGEESDLKVEDLKVGEKIMLNIATQKTLGEVIRKTKEKIELKLYYPIVPLNVNVAISRQIKRSWRLIGFGKITTY